MPAKRRFSVGATNIKTGNFVYFDNTTTNIKPAHVVASGSLSLHADPIGEMVESVLVAFDAYQSRENGKHTSRTMKENARQGFWNGSTAPYGYIPVGAERCGGALKDASPEKRKAYLKLFVDKVIVSKAEIRISGAKWALALAGTRGLPDTRDGVITFGREWRPVGDGKPFDPQPVVLERIPNPTFSAPHTR